MLPFSWDIIKSSIYFWFLSREWRCSWWRICQFSMSLSQIKEKCKGKYWAERSQETYLAFKEIQICDISRWVNWGCWPCLFKAFKILAEQDDSDRGLSGSYFTKCEWGGFDDQCWEQRSEASGSGAGDVGRDRPGSGRFEEGLQSLT